MEVPDFPLIFATYFYRGKSRELIFCYLVYGVYLGLLQLTLVDTNAEGVGDFVGECDFVDGVYEGLQWLSMGELGPAEN